MSSASGRGWQADGPREVRLGRQALTHLCLAKLHAGRDRGDVPHFIVERYLRPNAIGYVARQALDEMLATVVQYRTAAVQGLQEQELVFEGLDAMLRTQWAGQEVYIKKNDVDAEARAVAIRAKYNGRNRQELMVEYNIRRAQFYKILKGD